MQRHFDADLNKLSQDLLKMAVLTEEAIANAVQALRDQDEVLAQSVIDNDARIDEMEIMIEAQGIDLLALHQPMAIDLRLITTGMHINSELESMADMAVNIAYKVSQLCGQPLLKPLMDIPRLSDTTRKMVRAVIDAFINRSEDMAKEVIAMEEDADSLRNSISKKLIYDFMVKDGSTAPRAVALLLITRDLERICDYATNIAEDVVYMVRAQVVKHHHEKLESSDPAI